MDAQLSNQLARGLGAVANTFGTYAMAAHEERMQAAKEQFAAMLEGKRQAAEDARAQQTEAQRAADRASEQALARAQHQADKAQQASEAKARLTQEAAMHDDTNARLTANEKASQADRAAMLKVAQDKAAREAAAAKGPKPATQSALLDKVKYTDKALAAAQAQFSVLTGADPKDEQTRIGTAYGRALKDSREARAAAGLSPPVEVRVGSPAGASAPAPIPLQKIIKNGTTQFQKQVGGQWIDTTIQDAQKIHQENKALGSPSADVSTPASSVDTQDTSAPQPGATGADYAQAQTSSTPMQAAAAPDVQPPPLGQVDPNNPTLSA